MNGKSTSAPAKSPSEPAKNQSSDHTDLAGPGGIHMTGGDLTPPQNAGEKLQTTMDERRGEQQMQRRQMEGQVEQQTHSHNPSATDATGMPDAVTGRDVPNNSEANSA